MRSQDRFLLLLLLASLTVNTSSVVAWQQRTPERAKLETSFSSVTVADAIRMTRANYIDQVSGSLEESDVAAFSPNGNRFVVVVKTGNLEQNKNEYSLLLFRTEEAVSSPTPNVLASFSSASNRPGIQKVAWLNNRLLTFLGENPGELQQVYEVDCDTKHIRRLTNHPTNILSYAVGPHGGRLVFTAEQPLSSLQTAKTKRQGVIVQRQLLSDLVSGEEHLTQKYYQSLFVVQTNSQQETLLETDRRIHNSDVWLSPNGDYVIIKVMAGDIPRDWANYEDKGLQMFLRSMPPRFVYQYELIDMNSGAAAVLLDAPIGQGHTEMMWSPDGRSVVVSGIYLPLNISDVLQKITRQSHRFVAEIKIPSREILPITSLDMTLRSWDSQANVILLEPTRENSSKDPDERRAGYRKTATGWTYVIVALGEFNKGRRVEVTMREDMNTPPVLVAKDLASGKTAQLLDLNPQFKNKNFGRVEQIKFAASDGHEVNAGLYYPPTYMPTKRYPLIIQTHGWNPERFWIDGPWSTAFAAQPLAARGFVVVQLGDDNAHRSTSAEVKRQEAEYEGAIDHLDGLGLIERHNVGIIGFSRTAWAVRYALTHSKYHFNAATLADGVDGGYFTYLAYSNSVPLNATVMEEVNGGVPFGDSLESWLRMSPGFNLDRVNTPVRLEANSPEDFMAEWEWFAGLKRLGKPVDFIYLPEGAHVLVKPWDRLVSLQGNVDWFCFWLKSEEDADPSKGEQYTRWRVLQELREKERLANLQK